MSKVLAHQPFLQEDELPADPLNICTTELCRQIFVGIQSELAVIKANNPQQDAQFDRVDSTVVNSVNTTPWLYPSNQCRLDTLIAGALQKNTLGVGGHHKRTIEITFNCFLANFDELVFCFVF